jgi:radical SAM protein with 4Fe4S-binding SPASM domain
MPNEVMGNKIKDMIIYVTSDCNLSCKHCYVNTEKPVKQLLKSDLRWIHDTFDIRNVMLIGGEPTLYPDLDYAVKLFKKVTISTNGTVLCNGDKRANDLIELFGHKGKKISIQLSIDGNEEETNRIRGKEVWNKVMETADRLKESKIPCYFRCSYNPYTLNSIPWLVENISRSKNIPLVLFPHIGKPPLMTDQQIWLFNYLLETNSKYKLHNLIAQPHFMQWLGEAGRCEAASERLSITYNKDITPCHLDFDYILGSIGDNLDLININRETYLKMAKRIQPSCNFCENVEVCRSSCYVADSHAGCPLKQQFTLKAYANIHEVNVDSLSTQISEMKGLLKDSLVC